MKSVRLLVPVWMVLLLLLAGNRCMAQAVPDTSLKTVLPDTLVDRKEAELEERTQVSEAVTPVPETPLIKKGPFQPNPKKSALFAAIIPGTGQIYNRQYWKVPIVYGLAGIAVYFLVDNTTQYRKYRKAYVARLTNPAYTDEYTGRYSSADIQTLQDYYKKNLDLTYLLTGVGYALQVIDALAFAHLKNFDVSPNISMRMAPVGAPNGGIGLGLVVNWK